MYLRCKCQLSRTAATAFSVKLVCLFVTRRHADLAVSHVTVTCDCDTQGAVQNQKPSRLQ
jgi:hypothetical protein